MSNHVPSDPNNPDDTPEPDRPDIPDHLMAELLENVQKQITIAKTLTRTLIENHKELILNDPQLAHCVMEFLATEIGGGAVSQELHQAVNRQGFELDPNTHELRRKDN